MRAAALMCARGDMLLTGNTQRSARRHRSQQRCAGQSKLSESAVHGYCIVAVLTTLATAAHCMHQQHQEGHSNQQHQQRQQKGPDLQGDLTERAARIHWAASRTPAPLPCQRHWRRQQSMGHSRTGSGPALCSGPCQTCDQTHDLTPAQSQYQVTSEQVWHTGPLGQEHWESDCLHHALSPTHCWQWHCYKAPGSSLLRFAAAVCACKAADWAVACQFEASDAVGLDMALVGFQTLPAQAAFLLPADSSALLGCR